MGFICQGLEELIYTYKENDIKDEKDVLYEIYAAKIRVSVFLFFNRWRGRRKWSIIILIDIIIVAICWVGLVFF